MAALTERACYFGAPRSAAMVRLVSMHLRDRWCAAARGGTSGFERGMQHVAENHLICLCLVHLKLGDHVRQILLQYRVLSG